MQFRRAEELALVVHCRRSTIFQHLKILAHKFSMLMNALDHVSDVSGFESGVSQLGFADVSLT